MIPFPKFACGGCGREVASLYRDAVHVAYEDGERFHYAYLRAHRRPDGSVCPSMTSGQLAPPLGTLSSAAGGGIQKGAAHAAR